MDEEVDEDNPRATVKANRRRWDPPKKAKPVPRPDTTLGVFSHEDKNLLTSDGEGETSLTTFDEIQVMYEAEMEMGTCFEFCGTVQAGANPRSEDTVQYDSNNESDAAGETPSPNPHLDEETAAAEILTHFATISEAREAAAVDVYTPPKAQVPDVERGVQGAPAGAQDVVDNVMARSCSDAGTTAQDVPHLSDIVRAAPALVIALEGIASTDDSVLSPKERTRVFRGYRYIPSGPPPDVRPVNPPRDPMLPPPSGICGNCKSVEMCNADGNDGEGLCAMCSDCQIEGFLCWDHFNGLKDWEEAWLW
ncbi:hypothetical protein C8R43DRAFT_958456 [Mycena crocata]|nr:hypothetical protein C8R43DRAFT_958456 [Mycena crocata]